MITIINKRARDIWPRIGKFLRASGKGIDIKRIYFFDDNFEKIIAFFYAPKSCALSNTDTVLRLFQGVCMLHGHYPQ